MSTTNEARDGRHTPAGPALWAASAELPGTHIRRAAQTDRYWILASTDQRRWTLHILNDQSGEVGDQVRQLDTDNPSEAYAWAAHHTGALSWRPTDLHPGGHIDTTYDLVRDIARTPRGGRDIVVRLEKQSDGPPLALVVRERWLATDDVSEPLSLIPVDDGADHTDALATIAGWHGLSGRWVIVRPDEYRPA